jgi:hypothetical protein
MAAIDLNVSTLLPQPHTTRNRHGREPVRSVAHSPPRRNSA